MKIEIKREVTFEDGDIVNLLDTCLDAGCFSRTSWIKAIEEASPPLESRVEAYYDSDDNLRPLSGKPYYKSHVPAFGGILKITTDDDEEFLLGDAEIYQGLTRYLNENPAVATGNADDTLSMMDEYDADLVLQYGLFGEERYC